MLAVARGDLSAFEQLIVRHQGSAWNAAYRFLGNTAETRPSPEGVSLDEERAAVVRCALDSLPPNQKMAVVLRYYEDLSYRETATVLKTTIKGAEWLLARARVTLENRLGGYFKL